MRILLAGAAALALAPAGIHADPGPGRGIVDAEHSRAISYPAKSQANHNQGSARAIARGLAEKASRQAKRGKPEDKRHDGAADFPVRSEAEAARRALGVASDFSLGHARLAKVQRGSAGFTRVAGNGLIAGCPPGLAKKNAACLPPGQTSARPGRVDGWIPRLFGVTDQVPGRYRYAEGYLLHAATDGRIVGYVPLLGGALAVGKPWPSAYESSILPDYYVDFFDLGRADSFRFADDVIYRVDPEQAAIASIAALLTGDEFVVGQPMPQGYDVYNVPYSFRDQYVDTDEDWYRYADGYVYRIDPQTRLVAAAIELLV